MINTISIITPCYNAEQYIVETIESVINQTAVVSGRVNLEYIICDGKSTDGTIEKIQKTIIDFNAGTIKVISEKDSGMYEALAKGLKLASGDICAYINAGDYYSKYAFDVVMEVFETKKVKWLTGINMIYNEKSYIVHSSLPYKYRKRFFECGYYGKKLPFVQQESTFWDSTLNSSIDYDRLSSMKYAGDYYLWNQFAQVEELKIVESYLGGFRINSGQLSENIEAYYSEMNLVTKKPKLLDLIVAQFDKIIWLYTSDNVKRFLNRKSIFRYDHKLRKWV